MADLEQFLSTIKNEVDQNIENINKENLKKAVSIILESEKQGGRIHITGIGKPGHVAGYIASLLSSTGTPAYELHGTEAVHGSSGQVRSGDVVIAISNSGETSELKATVETLIANGAHVISCTGNENSWLSKHSEVCLVAHANQEGDDLNKAPRASIISEILVLQSLSVLLQEEKKLDLNQYVKWHPGGSLGQSIREIQKEEK
ncbi:SIS domain-containing protein [Anaerorhabdus furcosa]|uniref:Arabinose-5-phosphate isomerase n=1 Tax=Anaerorhabdus furcosa TaxID=118967 RepID=A0A1T4MLU4_9FIRM|nr:SIS domain-containing protein [Anaerorhabdus furcosa]SJZ67962.1 arabinose-5-phosphate isomerase [Anaerorhabdus furcosa]